MKTKLNISSQAATIILIVCSLMLPAQIILGVSPHPQLQDKIVSNPNAAPRFQAELDDRHDRGICVGNDDYFRRFLKKRAEEATRAAGLNGAPPLGQFRILAILVQFSDKAASTASTYFDSMMFSNSGPTVWDYYDEVSGSQIDLVTVNQPSSLGWHTAPSTLAYYTNGAYGTGSYPQNSQKLVEDLVDQIDPLVNFTNYDNDSNGYVDVLLVIHSGTGAEFSSDVNDFWSHQWGIAPRLKDGVYISSFTVQPEYWVSSGDMTIGVYAHELAHGFGLPDLYDTDYSSKGIGKWGLMSGGSWNGTGIGGNFPAWPSAYCRSKMGVETPTNITSNVTGQSITAATSGGGILRVWSSGAIGDEYFLIENRQKAGYDAYLPSEGLLIWHVDESIAGSNSDEWYPGQPAASHFKVALEQADGLFNLEHNSGNGDAGDVFPGSSSNSTFGSASLPSSDSYLSGATTVSVSNISSSGTVMTADLSVGLALSTD
ncbi:MAG: M6 family metalloprotease domain-containing protein, partial [candidate division Zixibacteria bacterium]